MIGSNVLAYSLLITKVYVLEVKPSFKAVISIIFFPTFKVVLLILYVTSSLTTILGFISFISLETLNSYKYLCLSNLKSIPSKITLSK